MSTKEESRFVIGTQFVHYHQKKRKDVYTIIDILTTRNNAGNIVNIEYLCEHEFMGATLQTRETDTAIAKSLFYNNQPNTSMTRKTYNRLESQDRQAIRELAREQPNALLVRGKQDKKGHNDLPLFAVEEKQISLF